MAVRIEVELTALSELRDKPAGTVRITAGDHAISTILWPRLSPLLAEYPDISIEFSIDYGLTDIVAQRFDAGVRFGERLEKDMIAVPIGPDARMLVVGSPAYFARYPKPRTPRELIGHNCINMRMPTYGGLYVWEFEQDGRELNVNVQGQLVFNAVQPMLEDWSPPFAGYHLYYPNRRRSSQAFSLVVEALRYPPR